MADGRDLRRLCGQLVIGGFDGAELPSSFSAALARGERGGATLFARNLTADPMQCAELTRAIADASPADLPPLVAIDQEGGRVARLKAPVLELPPMRWFGDAADAVLAHDAAEALALQLAALGITMNFAPVLDVNTCEANPIIGDRAFGSDYSVVAELGHAWTRGLLDGGVLACAKHYPGHGDTSKDSHLDLPVVTLDEVAIEDHVRPFARCSKIASAFMTAHVVYPALDPDVPATLSAKILGRLRAMFAGCIVSDDLEMKAIGDKWPIEDAAARAVDAGCDALLVCKSEELQERAVDGLARRATGDARFEARCRDALARGVAMRRRVPPHPARTRAELDQANTQARAVAARIAERTR